MGHFCREGGGEGEEGKGRRMGKEGREGEGKGFAGPMSNCFLYALAANA